MGKLLLQDKDVIVPGEVIAEGMDYLPSFGTYREGDKILANKIGLLSIDGKVLKIISLAGRYLPKRNDVVIGKVIDILISGWRIDLNTAYSAVLPLQEASFDYIQKGADLSKIFALDEYIVGKITRVTSQNLIDFSTKGPGLRKLSSGRIIKVSSTKVPRIIGKQGSMVSMIKETTGCKVTVGQNGIIWIEGEPAQEILTIKTIRMIEENAHKVGLTDQVKKFLDKNKIPFTESTFKKNEERRAPAPKDKPFVRTESKNDSEPQKEKPFAASKKPVEKKEDSKTEEKGEQ